MCVAQRLQALYHSRQLLGNTEESKEAFNVCRLWRWSLGPSGRPPLLAG